MAEKRSSSTTTRKRSGSTRSTGSRKSSGTSSRSGSKRSSGRTSASRTSTSSRNYGRASNYAAKKRRKEEHDEMRRDILLVLLFAGMVFLFLANLGLFDIVGHFCKMVMFGAVGAAAYVLPLVIFALVLYGMMSGEDDDATARIICVIVMYLLVAVVCDLMSGAVDKASTLDLAAIYTRCTENSNGGGIIGGLFAWLFMHTIGLVGTVLVLIVIAVICLVIITGKPLLRLMREQAADARDRARYRREAEAEYREEHPEEYDEGFLPDEEDDELTDDDIAEYRARQEEIARAQREERAERLRGEARRDVERRHETRNQVYKTFKGIVGDTNLSNDPYVRQMTEEAAAREAAARAAEEDDLPLDDMMPEDDEEQDTAQESMFQGRTTADPARPAAPMGAPYEESMAEETNPEAPLEDEPLADASFEDASSENETPEDEAVPAVETTPQVMTSRENATQPTAHGVLGWFQSRTGAGRENQNSQTQASSSAESGMESAAEEIPEIAPGAYVAQQLLRNQRPGTDGIQLAVVSSVGENDDAYDDDDDALMTDRDAVRESVRQAIPIHRESNNLHEINALEFQGSYAALARGTVQNEDDEEDLTSRIIREGMAELNRTENSQQEQGYYGGSAHSAAMDAFRRSTAFTEIQDAYRQPAAIAADPADAANAVNIVTPANAETMSAPAPVLADTYVGIPAPADGASQEYVDASMQTTPHGGDMTEIGVPGSVAADVVTPAQDRSVIVPTSEWAGDDIPAASAPETDSYTEETPWPDQNVQTQPSYTESYSQTADDEAAYETPADEIIYSEENVVPETVAYSDPNRTDVYVAQSYDETMQQPAMDGMQNPADEDTAGYRELSGEDTTGIDASAMQRVVTAPMPETTAYTQTNVAAPMPAVTTAPVQTNVAASMPEMTTPVGSGSAIAAEHAKVAQIHTENKQPAQSVAAMQNPAAAAQPAQAEPVKQRREYIYPPLSLLTAGNPSRDSGSDEELRHTAEVLETTLHTFNVNCRITDISQGPAVTRYELLPEQGVKVSKVVGLSDDIKLALAATDIRIEAPIPGKSAIGIEVPNKVTSTVSLRDILAHPNFRDHKSKLAIGIGKDISGQIVVSDLAKMPHVLIAGATGSGKSVCINTIIMSILYHATPEEVKLLMIDPKVVELSVYNGIPHLLYPVVTNPQQAATLLNWAVAEMESRYRKFADARVRDMKGYNQMVQQHLDRGETADAEGNTYRVMPRIVVIVDELADLMMVAKNDVETAICRLAQLARAAGIHLIIATQRPSVDVITGLIKANMPSRIAFAVSSGVDSRTILDMNGAEKLLGKGDMLFFPQGLPKPARIQGAFVTDDEVSDVVEFIREQDPADTEEESRMRQQMENLGSTGQIGSTDSKAQDSANDIDDYFYRAGKFIIEKDNASIGLLQRGFRIGFNRAARLMDQLCDAGVVAESEGTKSRRILMTEAEFEAYCQDNDIR